jgi:hypothetical protein
MQRGGSIELSVVAFAMLSPSYQPIAQEVSPLLCLLSKRKNLEKPPEA